MDLNNPKSNSVNLTKLKKYFFLLGIISFIYVLSFILYSNLPPELFYVDHPNLKIWPFIIPRGHFFEVPFIIGWVFDGGRYINSSLLFGSFYIMLFIGFILLFSLVANFKKNTIFNSKYWNFFLNLLTGFTAFLLLFKLRVDPDLNSTFADAAVYPARVEAGLINEASFLNDFIFIKVHNIINYFFENTSSIFSIQFTVCLFGGIFTSSAFSLAKTIGKNFLDRFILFFGLITGGYSIMFLGYIETTALELAMMALFFASSAKYFFNEQKVLWLVSSLLILSLVFVSHLGGLLLIIAIPVLVCTHYENNFIKTLLSFFTFKNIKIIFYTVILPLTGLFLWRYFKHTSYGDLPLGNNGFSENLMPFSDESVGLGRRNRPFYSFFSFNHFYDIFSVMLLASPMSIPLIVVSKQLKSKLQITLTNPTNRLLLLLFLCSGVALIIPLFWHHDFGTYGDWNISATYLFPLNLLGWVYFTVITSKFTQINNTKILLSSLMITTQLLMAGSLYLQLI